MAGKKISQLAALGGSFAATDLFEISKDDGGGSYSSKKITGTEMITSIGAGTVTSVAVSGGTTGLTTSGGPITGAGTITIGGALIAANGGTGQTSYSTGDLLYASGATAISKLAVGSDTEVLTLAGGVPTWAAPAGGSGTVTSVGTTGTVNGVTLTGTVTTSGSLTLGGTLAINNGDWSGTDLSVANGGTGASTLTANGVLIGNGTSAVAAVDMSTKGHILIGDGSGNPQMLAIGDDDDVLTADSGEATGVKWAAAGGGSAWTTSGSDIYYNTGMVGIGLTSGFGASLHVKGAGATSGTIAFQVDSSTKNLMKIYNDGATIRIGSNAGYSGGSGINAIYIGASAGYHPTGGSSVAIGTGAYQGTSAGNSAQCVAIGYGALRYVIDARFNTALGYNAGFALTGGYNNTLLGHTAGDNLILGGNNIIIGKGVDASATDVDDEINIGGNIIGSMTSADRYTTFIGQAYSPTSTLTSSANITPAFTNGNTFKVTLAHNTTLENPTNPKDGATYTVIVTQDVTGSRTMAYGANYKWSGGSAPTLSTAGDAVDILTFISDGTNMYGTSNLNFS